MSDETTNQINKQANDKDSKSSGSPPVGPLGSSLIAAYLILLSIILLVAIVQSWPSLGAQRGQVNPMLRTKFLLWTFMISQEACLILIVILAGALGGLVRSLRSLAWYTGNKELKRSWLLLYILSPFVGATLATVTYLVIRGGFVSAGSTIQQPRVYVYAGIASIVGIASEPVALKLKQVAESLFTKPGEGKDSKPQGKP